MKNLFWKFITFFVYGAAIIVTSVRNWADKQQQTYEDYQSPEAQEKRRAMVLRKHLWEEIAENRRAAKKRERDLKIS